MAKMAKITSTGEQVETTKMVKEKGMELVNEKGNEMVNERKPLRIGMISFAHMHATSYLRAALAHKDAEVVGIADEQQERVAPFTEPNGIRYFSDVDSLLQESIDAVIICSENARHLQHTEMAARAGKHVLCEKPLGTSEADMQAMIDICRQHGVQLMTAFPCRYLPSVMEAKKAVEAGEIGEIVAMKGLNRGTMPGGWFQDRSLSGGGAVLDHTVHVMDLMHWFSGSRACEVYAYADTLFHDTDIDDAGMVHVHFENGAFGVLDPSWSRPASFPTWGDVVLQIVGTKGYLNIDAFAQKNEIYSDVDGKAGWDYWGDNMDDGLIDAFVTSLLSGQNVPISGTDGFLSARVGLAAYRSAASGQPVRLD